MLSCGSNVYEPGLNDVVMTGFAYLHFRKRIQSPGKRSSKSREHVLENNHSRRNVCGQLRQKFLQGFRAAGRCAQDDDFGNSLKLIERRGLPREECWQAEHV